MQSEQLPVPRDLRADFSGILHLRVLSARQATRTDGHRHSLDPRGVAVRHPAVLLLLALATSAAAPAGAALCRKRNGTVVSRSACRKKETTLDLTTLSAGAKGPDGAAGTTPPRLRVVDATGQRLPGVVNPSGHYIVAVGAKTVRIAIERSGFPASGALHFETVDCTGPPLVAVSPDAFFDRIPVRGTTAFYAGEPITSHAMKSQQVPTPPSSCTGAGRAYDVATGLCCVTGATTGPAGSPTPLDLGTWVPPFRVEIDE
jgi:hypothetical protein